MAVGWVSTFHISSLTQVGILHLILGPIVFCLGAAHPICLLLNWLLGPLLGQVLLPACMLTMIVPNFSPVVDKIWSCLLVLLQSAQTTSTTENLPLQVPLFIFYGLTLQFIWLHLNVWRLRRD